MEERQDEPASIPVELAGWVGFLVFVALVYRLRQSLNRSGREQ